jgi:hypothetical protein
MADNQLDRIIDIARGASPAGPSERENREACRIPYTGTVAMITIRPTGTKTEPILVIGENISTGGIAVLSKQEIPVGSRGGLLIMRSDGESVVLGARVVHVTDRRPGGYECGIEFENEPSVVSLLDFQNSAGNLPQIGHAKAA